MPMTLGERLNNYLSKLDQKQSAVATDWLERYKKQTPKARWEAETIISHLNRCLKEKREGVKFFFDHDALRTDLLFELLRIPSAEHAELRGLARECLDKEGEVNCRLVIDVTTWGASREQSEPLFDALKVTVLQPAEKLKLTPVVLVFTEEQFDFLPRSYDRLGEWLIREEVKDRQEAWTKIAKLAGDGALVVSSRQFQPLERWLAMATSGKNLSLEPSDGLESFSKNARLSAPLAQVPHDLAKIATINGNSKARIPSTPIEIRRMMLALGSEEQSAALKLSPSDRLAIAQALGVTATSTERERLEHELAGLASHVGLEPKSLNQTELDQILARAQRREVEFSLMRVGDQLHALNPPPKTTLPKHARLIVHRMKSRRPAINRLMDVIDNWTADDYAADRGFMKVIERLDPKGEERVAFLHARACLMWSNGLCSPTVPTPLPDWKDGLNKLLAGEPPAAQLRLFVSAEERQLNKQLGHKLKPCLVLKQELEETWPNFVPGSIRALKDPVASLLQIVPDRGPMLVGRTQALHLLDSYDREEGNYYNPTRYSAAEYYRAQDYSFRGHIPLLKELPGFPSVLLPHSWKLLREKDLWLDLFDCSSALSGQVADPASWARVGTELAEDRLLPIRQIRLYRESVGFPRDIWADADQELALCWLALRNALAQGHAVRLHDGVVLLSMGAGLCARINIRRCSTVEESTANEQQVRGCLDAWVRHGKRKTPDGEEEFWGVRLDHRQVTTHRATTTGYGDITATTTLGYDLPELYLAGHGLRAEITFLTSPLFLSYGGMMPPVAALAAAGTQALGEAQHEEQRRADDAAYNDDDDD